MALAFRLESALPLDHVPRAWAAVVARHGTLRTRFVDGSDGLDLQAVDVTIGDWQHHPAREDESTRAVVRRVLDATCRPFGTPSHRLCVVLPDPGDDDPRPVLVVAADHCHLDMWSLLVLLRDLRTCLSDLVAGREPGAGLPPAEPFAEHTRRLAAQDAAPADVTARWADVLAHGGGSLPRFPLPLGDVSTPRAEVVEVRDVLDADGLDALEKRAADHGVRITALALAEVAAATRDLSGQPLRAVFPVHSRHEPVWHGSVGWFITNSVLECGEVTPAACAAALRESLALGSYPLAPILGHLDRELSPPGMFALSWLDTRRLPSVPDGLDVQYVSAVICTDGVMAWFLAGDSGLHVRCRYPDTPEARQSVPQWLDAIGRRLRDTTAP